MSCRQFLATPITNSSTKEERPIGCICSKSISNPSPNPTQGGMEVGRWIDQKKRLASVSADCNCGAIERPNGASNSKINSKVLVAGKLSRENSSRRRRKLGRALTPGSLSLKSHRLLREGAFWAGSV